MSSTSPTWSIRTATAGDAGAITALEATCFPPEQAASAQAIAGRLAHFPDHVWLLEEGGELLAMVNGLCTDDPDLTDAMFADASHHSPSGAWQMIFSVATAPAAQGRGLATALLRHVVEQCAHQGRQGLVLTCLPELVGFYARLGFVDEGISGSQHGGVAWHQMRLRLGRAA
ncbi:GNAT family N-acetyltransferase [Actinomyces slackii]|uniref:Predicted acetyltransferase n=1 Tax=Actinomyces slackii TaxID=52774 RepID=A0A3S4SJE3_9ACTO|nr:GNAT family N-acetyltransferase [Actinomyces slackii]VEG74081.1 Predicted acetyltransferase [Actinomyces slackii]